MMYTRHLQTRLHINDKESSEGFSYTKLHNIVIHLVTQTSSKAVRKCFCCFWVQLLKTLGSPLLHVFLTTDHISAAPVIIRDWNITGLFIYKVWSFCMKKFKLLIFFGHHKHLSNMKILSQQLISCMFGFIFFITHIWGELITISITSIPFLEQHWYLNI